MASRHPIFASAPIVSPLHQNRHNAIRNKQPSRFVSITLNAGVFEVYFDATCGVLALGIFEQNQPGSRYGFQTMNFYSMGARKATQRQDGFRAGSVRDLPTNTMRKVDNRL